MKKWLGLVAVLLIPVMASAAITETNFKIEAPQNEGLFAGSFQTATIQWGCPISDTLNVKTKAEALQQLRDECLSQAAQAASQKADVIDVIQTSMIYNDVRFAESSSGLQANGTMFLETIVRTRGEAQ